MPDATTPADPKAAAASPLAWPLNLIDGTGRVYTSFQLGASPTIKKPTYSYRALATATGTNWSF